MDDVARWLETEAGERWSFAVHRNSRYNYRCWLEFLPLNGDVTYGSWLSWDIEYGSSKRSSKETKPRKAARTKRAKQSAA